MKSAKGAITKQGLAYTVVIAACLLLIATMVLVQGEMVNSVRTQVAKLVLQASSTQLVQTASSELPKGWKMIAEHSVEKNGVHRFSQRCDATVQQLEGQNHSFCVGKNELVYRSPAGVERVIDTTEAVNPTGAPVFFDATLLSSNAGRADVLINYGMDVCVTDNNCGVGMPLRYVSLIMDLNTGSVREVHFPDYGKLVWNPAGTKAVLVSNTCGGTGCMEEVLRGYDLVKDAIKVLTTDKASDEQGTDIGGRKLSYWSEVFWSNDTTVTATVIAPNGSKRQLKIVY